MTSMEELEEMVKILTVEREEKANSLELAAKIGKQLLEANNELTTKFDQSCSESMVKIESLEQEIFLCERKLGQRFQMETVLKDEIESLHKQLGCMQEQQETKDTRHDSVERQMAKQATGMQLDLEKSQLSSGQLQQRNSDLQGMLDDVRSQLKDALASRQASSSLDELSQLHYALQALQSEKSECEEQLRESENMKEQCSLEVKSLRMKLSEYNEELDEVKSEATSYYNTLLKSRDEVKELNVEIDLLKMESQNRDKKGNSLFSEVEDRRIEAEKELISVNVKHKALLKQHKMTKEHLHQLNVQIAGLLQTCGGRADKRHVERLQEQLSESFEQIKAMEVKIKKYENEEKTNVDYLQKFKANPLMEGSDESHRIEFLQTLLRSKESELSESDKKASQLEFMRLAESQRFAKQESRLYSAERQRECLQRELIKKRNQVDELLLKYEPDSVQGTRKSTDEAEREAEEIPKVFDVAAEEDEVIEEEPDFFMKTLLKIQNDMKKSSAKLGAKGPSPKKQQKVTRVAFKDVENTKEVPNIAKEESDTSQEMLPRPQTRVRQKVNKCVKLKTKEECKQQ